MADEAMPTTPAAPATPSPAPPATAPATQAPAAQPPAAADPAPAPKGQPSQEQQIARIVAEALKPINEKLAAIDGADPAAANQAAQDAQASIEEVNAKHAAAAKAWAVERALLTAGCIDSVGAMAHVKMDAVELAEDGTLKEFDAAKLAADHPHLFKAAATPAVTVSTGAPAAGAPTSEPAKTIKEGLAAAMKKQGA